MKTNKLPTSRGRPFISSSRWLVYIWQLRWRSIQGLISEYNGFGRLIFSLSPHAFSPLYSPPPQKKWAGSQAKNCYWKIKTLQEEITRRFFRQIWRLQEKRQRKKKKARKEKKLSAGVQVKEREICRERVRLYIEKEKETRIFRILKLLYKHPKIPHTRHLSHYFGKAIHKVKKALPKNPRKKKGCFYTNLPVQFTSIQVRQSNLQQCRAIGSCQPIRSQRFSSFFWEILSPDKHQEFAIMSLCSRRARRSSSRRDTWCCHFARSMLCL